MNEKYLRAIQHRSIPDAIEAIKAGADINAVDNYQNNAIHLALISENEEVLSWLLKVEKAGEKINLNQKNRLGETPLLALCKSDMFNKDLLVAMANSGANPNETDNLGLTPLFHLLYSRSSQNVLHFLEIADQFKQPLDIDFTTPGNSNALLVAVQELSNAGPVLSKMIDLGADINATDADGETLLIKSLTKLNSDPMSPEKNKLVSAIIRLPQIDLNKSASSGATPIWLACAGLHMNIIEDLIERGVNVEVSHSRFGGDTFQVKKSALSVFIEENLKRGVGLSGSCVETIEKLIKAGADINKKDNSGNTPSSYLMTSGDVSFSLAKQIGADVNAEIYINSNKKYGSKKTNPLTYRIRCDMIDEHGLREAVESGAKIEFSGGEMDAYEQPLIAALYQNNIVLIKALLNEYGVDTTKTYQEHVRGTHMSHDVNLFEVYLKGNFHQSLSSVTQKINMCNHMMSTLERSDKEDSKREKLEGLGHQLHELTEMQEGLVEDAKGVLDALIASGANVNGLNNKNENALFFTSNPAILLSLIKDHVADMSVVNYDGDSLLSQLMIKSEVNLLRDLLPILKERGSGLEQGIYDLAFNERVSEKEVLAISKCLDDLDCELNVNIKDDNGNTPLIIASASGSVALCKKLIDMGADVNAQNNNGETAIMHALESGNAQIAEALLLVGADTELVNKDNLSFNDLLERLPQTKINNTLKDKIISSIQAKGIKKPSVALQGKSVGL